MVRGIHKCHGGRPFFACEQSSYLKHSPGNPFFGCQHNGSTEAYFEGFSVKPMNWLYRFRWNITENRGACPLYLKNPGGKTPHWLQITAWSKFKPHLLSHEGMPHVFLFVLATSLITWNLTRYLFFHPDLTLYNIAYFTLRKYMSVLRNDVVTNLDTPVFRWAQQPPEIYNYNQVREMLDVGVIANDPFIEYMKAIGKQDLLSKKPGEAGFNTATEYLPHHKWGWSYYEKGPSNPIPTKGGDAHGAHH